MWKLSSFSSFRALQLSKLDNFVALELSYLEEFKALKLFNLLMATYQYSLHIYTSLYPNLSIQLTHLNLDIYQHINAAYTYKHWYYIPTYEYSFKMNLIQT